MLTAFSIKYSYGRSGTQSQYTANVVCRLPGDGQVFAANEGLRSVDARYAQSAASYDELSPRFFQMASAGSARFNV